MHSPGSQNVSIYKGSVHQKIISHVTQQAIKTLFVRKHWSMNIGIAIMCTLMGKKMHEMESYGITSY